MMNKELENVTSRNESIEYEIETLTKESEEVEASLKILKEQNSCCEEEDKIDENILIASKEKEETERCWEEACRKVQARNYTLKLVRGRLEEVESINKSLEKNKKELEKEVEKLEKEEISEDDEEEMEQELENAKKQLDEAEKENQSLSAKVVQREAWIEDMKNQISLKVEQKKQVS